MCSSGCERREVGGEAKGEMHVKYKGIKLCCSQRTVIVNSMRMLRSGERVGQFRELLNSAKNVKLSA